MTLNPATNANEQLMDTLYRAWRDKDPHQVIDCFTDDCVYEDMAMRVINHGKAELTTFVNGVYTTMPDFDVRHTIRFANATRGSGYWVINATWNGLFEGVDKTGTQLRFEGISLYEFRDGRICRNTDCWDPTVMYEQFSVLPAGLSTLAGS